MKHLPRDSLSSVEQEGMTAGLVLAGTASHHEAL